MLSFDRRVTLEDHLGQRHRACILETIDGHLFVLVPPREAERLAALQAAGGPPGGLLDILEDAIGVMDVRRHEFLSRPLAAVALARSSHQVLRMLAARLDDDAPGLPAGEDDDLSAHAFLEECRRRSGG